ncbi:MAG: formyltetrahydrofolate deformylase [Bacteroidales bacterium]|nr:formyltetrahydrofolate deformylase [Bacteroidales bacterium]
MNRPETVILLIHCDDRKGIVAAVSSFITEHNGNIIYLDQHVEITEGVFFMRIEWELDGFTVPAEEINGAFSPIADRFKMKWEIHFSRDIPIMAIFVSKLPHCLDDILARYHAGEWKVQIPLIISNHEQLRPIAEKFEIDFYHVPKNNDNKAAAEAEEVRLMEQYDIDFMVLARYMQIFSEDFVGQFENRIINIHHSFLPAFPGAKPYHSAFERGVKLIGATSHFITIDLDSGPIIEQDVVRITHRDSVENMLRKGRDLEKIVLSNAIHTYITRKIIVYRNKTVVFT